MKRLILPELVIVSVVNDAIAPLGLRTGRAFPSRSLKERFGLVKMAGFADAIENKLLDHIYRAVTLTPPNPLYLALTTAAVNETHAGNTITEAGYTTYARLALAPAAFPAASAGEVHNSAQQTFPACTAGTSTVIGWAMVATSSGAGDIYHFGTCTSTVISTTQTPPTINASALSMSLD